MRLVVWNSQGATDLGTTGGRWDALWNNWITPLITPSQTEDVLGLTVEAGWAPWIQSGELSRNHIYWLDIGSTRYDDNGAAASPFCVGVEATRRRKAFWMPWVGDLNAMKTNTRCSMGGVVLPFRTTLSAVDMFELWGHYRPTVRIQLAAGRTTDLSVFLVHLVSGSWKKASDHLFFLADQMSRLIPQSTPAIIVGDMNINLLGVDVDFGDPRWKILRTKQSTQKSGGELDFAVVYQPNKEFANATAAVLTKYKTPPNNSDHSVMRYSL